MSCRGIFFATIYAMLGPVTLAAFIYRTPAPIAIWVVATFIAVFTQSRRK